MHEAERAEIQCGESGPDHLVKQAAKEVSGMRT
jgi:hypothetical protein